jgi:hypothetical protein
MRQVVVNRSVSGFIAHLPAKAGPGMQRHKVDLGVDHRGLRVAMTQDLCDLAERGAVAEHLRGQRVAQQVRSLVGESIRARCKARRTMQLMALGPSSARTGARDRMNTLRMEHAGRPWRK